MDRPQGPLASDWTTRTRTRGFGPHNLAITRTGRGSAAPPAAAAKADRPAQRPQQLSRLKDARRPAAAHQVTGIIPGGAAAAAAAVRR